MIKSKYQFLKYVIKIIDKEKFSKRNFVCKKANSKKYFPYSLLNHQDSMEIVICPEN